MTDQANAFLKEERTGVLMRKFALPCIISLLVAALYNIVDQIFIANASYLGSHGNAANNAVFPLTVIALAVAVMIGDGCCAFVSISMGAGEEEKAHRSIGCSIVICVLASLFLTALYLVFQDQILSMFGGRVNEETFANAREYFVWITAGLPFYMFGQMMNPVIRSDGSPKFAMVSIMAGAVTNLILDPICIFGLRWGMMGAAVATIAGQILTASLAAWYLFHMKAVKLKKESLCVSGGLMRAFLPLGITSFLSQISVVASMAAMNNMIVKYSAQDEIFGRAEYAQIPMAVVGIVMKFFQIVISISVGLAAGCIPIVGYNIGAKRMDRALELFRKLLAAEFAAGLVGLLIVEFLPGQLAVLFGAANESRYYTEFALRAFRLYLCMMPLATVNKGTFIFLQSMGKAAVSSVLSMIREILFGVGWALVLPAFLGLDGVLYSMPVSDLLTFLIAVVVIRNIWRQLGSRNCAGDRK